MRPSAPAVLVGATCTVALALGGCSVEAGKSTDNPTTTSSSDGEVSNVVIGDQACSQEQYARACTTLKYAFHLFDEHAITTTTQPTITRTGDGRFRVNAAGRRDNISFNDLHESFVVTFTREPGWHVVERDPVGHLVATFERPGETPLTARIDTTPVPGEHAATVGFMAETEPNPIGDGS